MTYITYIFGNGLDLACGLNTRFCDMYQDYINEPSDSEIIKAFKHDIATDKTMHYQNWSDFEMGMAKYATKLDSEKSLKACLSDFKKFMIKYLKQENNRFFEYIQDKDVKTKVVAQFDKEILSYKGDDLPPNERNEVRRRMSDASAKKIISFNYTNIAHGLVSGENINSIRIYQVHGTLSAEVIMGVDNETQIADLPYELTKSGKRAFVKTQINSEFNRDKVSEIQRIISLSDLIIIFGWALGDSDLFWRVKISEWLLGDINRQIIYFKKDTNATILYEAGDLLDEIDFEREKFMDLIGIPKDKRRLVEDRIHIPINNSKFKIETPNADELNLGKSKIVKTKQLKDDKIDSAG